MVRYLPYARGSRGRRGCRRLFARALLGPPRARRRRRLGKLERRRRLLFGRRRPLVLQRQHRLRPPLVVLALALGARLVTRVRPRRLPVEVLRLRRRLARRRRLFERIRLPRHPRRRLGRLSAHRVPVSAHRLVGQRGRVLRPLARRIVTLLAAFLARLIMAGRLCEVVPRIRCGRCRRRRWRWRRRRRGARRLFPARRRRGPRR